MRNRSLRTRRALALGLAVGAPAAGRPAVAVGASEADQTREDAPGRRVEVSLHRIVSISSGAAP